MQKRGPMNSPRRSWIGMCALLAFGALAGSAGSVRAEGNPGEGFGLGIMVGEPTGVNFKNWTGSKTAFVGGAAWSFTDNGSFAFHLDYVFHNFDWISVEKGRLPVYFGIGGRIKLQDVGDDSIGARIPVGLDYLLADAPLDFFVEVVPVLDLAPKTEFNLNAAIGGRFFF